ncbi:MAG: hypothetical protein Q7T71_14380 [Herbiconiux sp.]|nr:hypothetical protein [Herbiconiux sp.]
MSSRAAAGARPAPKEHCELARARSRARTVAIIVLAVIAAAVAAAVVTAVVGEDTR